MVVIVGLRKLTNGGIQIRITRPRQGSSAAQTYTNEDDAREVLRRMGVGENAIDYYLLTLLPWLSGGEQLMFPPMDIPLSRLSPLGFKVGRIPLVRQP